MTRTTRRKFLQTTAAAGVGFWVAGGVSPRPSRAANEKINFACIGVGGKGSSDSGDAARHGNIVAICDVDDGHLEQGRPNGSRTPRSTSTTARCSTRSARDIDAVTVSTPDHNARAGRHPGHEAGQALLLPEAADPHDLRSPPHGRDGPRDEGGHGDGQPGHGQRGAAAAGGAWSKSGGLGKVKEVHVWTNRPIWPQGSTGPTETPPVPADLHWDEWLGPAPMRPYHPAYHPFKWRGWWDFGTGALGDMACHTLNMPFAALSPARPDLGSWPRPRATTRKPTRLVDHHVRVPGDRQTAGRHAEVVRRRQAAARRSDRGEPREAEHGQRCR